MTTNMGSLATAISSGAFVDQTFGLGGTVAAEKDRPCGE
jgi:hypothetical protein